MYSAKALKSNWSKLASIASGLFLLTVIFILFSYSSNPPYTVTTVTYTHYPVPSQHWIKQQMEVAYRALHSTYTPPTDWKSVNHPKSYYFPNINIIFTGILKVGCSNWEEALLRAEGALRRNLTSKQVAIVHGGVISPYRMTNFKEWGGRYDEKIETATSIVVLRNPWVRAVSAFRQKLSAERTQGHSLKYAIRHILVSERGFPTDYEPDFTIFPTFEEFVRCSVKAGGLGNNHFKPQSWFMSQDKVRYDAVIPLEFAGPMSDYLFKELGTNVTMFGAYDQESDPQLQSSVVKAKEWFSSLDPAIVEEFYKIYKEDFLMLNYSNFSDPNFPYPVVNY